MKFGNALAKLWCQGRKGAPQKVPKDGYPYLRYIRHDSSWSSESSSEQEIINTNLILRSVTHFLSTVAGVSI
jgi:hypothetical protein